MRLILFGAGRKGAKALSFPRKENVAYFCDNKIDSDDEEERFAMNNWKKIWDKKQTEQDILLHGTPKDIFMELKRSNGFDVVDNAVSYQAFYGQCQDVLQSLRGGRARLRVYLRSAAEVGQTYICMSRPGLKQVG